MSATERPTTRPRPPADDVMELATRLRLSATRLARRLRQEAETDLTPSMHSALSAVHVHGPLTLGALAEHERLTPPSVTKVVGRLEDQGLVERRSDPTDRRVCRVSTTEAGEHLLAASRAQTTAWLAARLAGLPAAQRARLLEAVDVLEGLVALEPASPTERPA